MKSIIVGTAGHIDHGKTALVKALTGIDADRLEEEKRRGITIDLGFANMDLQMAGDRAENDAAKNPANNDPAKNDPAKGGETLRIGFVDVPGHERFVRNMLAGVGGIDLVLLVIAADEGIKPQTREHFDILQLLGVRRGITVLTKADAVDAETLEVVRLEVQEFLRGTFLDNPKSDDSEFDGAKIRENAESEKSEFLDRAGSNQSKSIVAVSSRTGAGLEELKRALVAAAGEVTARDSKALVRLPIDRVFTMKGFGTVVTGTLVAGTIRAEDELEVFPTGQRVRVRGVQVHGQVAEAAVAGQRTALNLAGASTEDLARGMTLAPPETFRTTRVVDVKMRLLASAPRALKDGARVHFHSYTMESVGEVRLYEARKMDHTQLHDSPVTTSTSRAQNAREIGPPLVREFAESPTLAAKNAARMGHLRSVGRPELFPGGEAFAQIRLAEAALLMPGDRFILRQFSPVVTIGGGVVLDAAPMTDPKGVRKLQKAAGAAIPAFVQSMEEFGAGRAVAILARRVARRGMRGLTLAEAVAETGWWRAQVVEIAQALIKDGLLVRFQDRLFGKHEFELAQAGVLDAVSGFHGKNPLSAGMSKGELQDELQRALEMSAELFAAAVESLARAKKLELVNELVRLPGRGVVMKDEEAESKKTIEAAFATAGLKVPALQEVIAGLKIDKVRAQKIVTLLLRDRVLVKVSDELVFHRGALEQLRRDLAAHKTKSAKIDVAKFKELTGVSRKYAIPLLEYLDRERVTRRVGDVREIL
jgi:selenocysteine-specific elongation factor